MLNLNPWTATWKVNFKRKELSMEKEKKKRGRLIPTLIISLIFLGAIAFGIMRIIQNPDAYNKKQMMKNRKILL